MDRISGLMPQVGWSTLTMPLAVKKAPATTVEPAATAANTNGGMGANVNTQTGGGQAVATAQARAATGSDQTGITQAVLAQVSQNAEPDPDAPTGPPPTFDVTPLEAQAAALRKVPPQVGSAQAASTEEAPAPAEPATTEATASAPQAESTPPPAESAPEAQPASSGAAGAWQASAAQPEPSLDVIR